MSKEHKYMTLILKNRKDGIFTFTEFAGWIALEDNISYSASRSKAKRLMSRIPCEALSKTMFRLTWIPDITEDAKEVKESKEPKLAKSLVAQDQMEIARTIIAYLNQELGTKYRGSAPDILKIKARLNEGFTLMDFKLVIDKKVAEWKGTSMAAYLRPETLFGSKFEGYLNAEQAPKGKAGEMSNYDFKKYLGG